MLNELSDVFEMGGALDRAGADYRLRPAQTELARAIAQAIDQRSVLIAEAGTGTGKTFAYLAPAFLSGLKVLISTGTRTLQDQLFHRDVPRLRNALALPLRAALLKGRGNYVCHYHLDRLGSEDWALRSRHEIRQLNAIQEFARHSDTGDRSELLTVPEEAELWQRVTSTRENCLGSECPFVGDCFVLKARRKAQDADLVVVNHALFMADLALREEGVTDLLPEAGLVVFDEAHQLPDIATRFLGSSVSSHQLLDLCKIVEAAGLAHAREATHWPDRVRQLDTATRELRLQAAGVGQLPGSKATFEALPQPDAFDRATGDVLAALDDIIKALQVVQDHHPDLAAAAASAQALRARLFLWTQPDRQGRIAADSSVPDECGDAVRWVEYSSHMVRLHRAPLSVAPVFSRARRVDQAWVLTSATLSVNRNFGHFAAQLGLSGADTAFWESPFDYASQGLLYVPSGLPLPSSPGFSAAFVEELLALIPSVPGGIMVLCTTLRAVGDIARGLADHFDAHGVDRPVLRQGDASRAILLDRFREHGNAVLVGSASFWEGVDVPGDALSLLAIDKLPFAPPDDPVLQARLNQCRSRGGNPFMEYQLPEAAITLKQGAGRLIRSEQDRGVLLVGDTRLVDKPYGKLLWRGLPPFARTRVQDAAREFLGAMSQARPPGADQVMTQPVGRGSAPEGQAQDAAGHVPGPAGRVPQPTSQTAG